MLWDEEQGLRQVGRRLEGWGGDLGIFGAEHRCGEMHTALCHSIIPTTAFEAGLLFGSSLVSSFGAIALYFFWKRKSSIG